MNDSSDWCQVVGVKYSRQRKENAATQKDSLLTKTVNTFKILNDDVYRFKSYSTNQSYYKVSADFAEHFANENINE